MGNGNKTHRGGLTIVGAGLTAVAVAGTVAVVGLAPTAQAQPAGLNPSVSGYPNFVPGVPSLPYYPGGRYGTQRTQRPEVPEAPAAPAAPSQGPDAQRPPHELPLIS